MTSPNPFAKTGDYEELRKRWLARYIKVQGGYDARLRSLLIEAAEDAHSRISVLSKNPTWSAGVKAAQIRLVGKEIKRVLDELFKEELPIIKDGQKKTAIAAVDAFAETDRNYLREAFFASSGSRKTLNSFIEGQRLSATLGVAHAISRINKTDQPLSTRVYRTKSLANKWVQNIVNVGILRNASAQEIAKDVRKHIHPNTPGGVSYAAMRLSRTEINNAFHATSVALSQDRPWVEGMDWNLSQVHEYNENGISEICEIYSRQEFEVNNVPPKPHPQCRCFVTPQVEPYDVFVRHLTSGQYRDWIGQNAA